MFMQENIRPDAKLRDQYYMWQYDLTEKYLTIKSYVWTKKNRK